MLSLKFQFAHATYDKLKEMAHKREKGNTAEVVRKALSLYSFCLDKIEEGYEIQMSKDNTINTINMP